MCVCYIHTNMKRIGRHILDRCVGIELFIMESEERPQKMVLGARPRWW
jgi:hypothetical protein